MLLPAASWAEKEGTVTNSERRISRVRAAVAPPGEARPDWEIAVAFARKLFPAKAKLFPYRTPEEIFNEHRETTRGRDLDITGLSYALLERDGPQQWPYPRWRDEPAAHASTRDGVFPTPSGRARFVATEYAPPAEAPDADYPISLTTGPAARPVAQHDPHRPGRAPLQPQPRTRGFASEETLSSMGIRDGDLARVSSRRGSIVLKARASSDMRAGDAFVAMHWGSRFMSGVGTNALTLPAIDPYSKQPELKHAAVRIEPFAARWRGTFTAAATPDRQAFATACLDRFDYAALSLVEGPEILLRLDLATAAIPTPRPSPPSKTSSAALPTPAEAPSTPPSAPASKSPSPPSAPPSPPAPRSPSFRKN